MNKKALIFGVTGQDGAYLSEFLLAKGYEVHGIKRRSSQFNTDRIDHLYQSPQTSDAQFYLHYGDLTDALSVYQILQKVKPDEIYNLGAMSHVKVSFELPEYTANVGALGTLRILESLKMSDWGGECKYYQASTSELYGKASIVPQNEQTPFYPRSPYAIAKLYAYWTTVNYREAYGIFASNGIMFNHESPLRGETFLSSKVCKAVIGILNGTEEMLYIGNLDAERDWGHAKDYVKAMWQILQHDKADDFVIATGVKHSVRTFIRKAFQTVGISLIFKGKGKQEKGHIEKIDPLELKKWSRKFSGIPSLKLGKVVVCIDERYFRPTEVDILQGDASKAQKLLGWQPSYTLNELIHEMLKAALEKV